MADLKKTDIVVGSGPEATSGHSVSVHYTGWLHDPAKPDGHGSKFDSSVDRGQPFDFNLGARAGDPRLGRGRGGHEGRRQAHARDPAGDGLRRARRGRRDPAERDAGLRRRAHRSPLIPGVVLQTERLSLRRLEPADAPFMLGLLNDSAWVRYIGDRGVRDVEGARGYLQERVIVAYERDGFGLWMVESRDGARPMGICGLVKREVLEDADLGFAFMPEFRGKGIAYESALASRDYAMNALGMKRLLAITSPAEPGLDPASRAPGIRLRARDDLGGRRQGPGRRVRLRALGRAARALRAQRPVDPLRGELLLQRVLRRRSRERREVDAGRAAGPG